MIQLPLFYDCEVLIGDTTVDIVIDGQYGTNSMCISGDAPGALAIFNWLIKGAQNVEITRI